MDDFGLLVGRYFSTLPTLTDTQVTELMVDDNGRQIISGRYFEDSAHTSGDAGIFVMGVRNDNDAILTDADLDYTPISVDSQGRVKVLADLDVDFDHIFAEDTGHTTGDLGSFGLSIRLDDIDGSNSALLAGTDGDYQGFFTNIKGELYVHDTDLLAKATDVETALTNLTHDEDTAHSSGDKGTMPLAVRADADGTLADTDGDYAPFQVNSEGKLKVVSELQPDGAEQYTITDALAIAGDALEVITATATPWVTVASIAVGAGSTAHIYGWQFACDQNCQARIMTDDTTNEIVYKTNVNSSAQPGPSEHWSESGRIEVAGAANLELRIEMKKRSATGGNANGTGSIHVRVI